MLKSLLYIIPLGCFCVLAAYSQARHTPTRGHFASQYGKEVKLVRASIADLYSESERCGLDIKCLTDWAAEEHPVKRRK